MALLEKLKFADAMPAVTRTTGEDPKVARRTRFLEALNHQIELDKSPEYKFKAERYQKGADGKLKKTDTEIAPRSWVATSGDDAFIGVKYGNRPILLKDKPMIVTCKKAQVGRTLKLIADAAAAGELDAAIESAAARVRKPA